MYGLVLVDQSIFTFLDTFLIVTFPFAEGFTLPHGNDSGNDDGNVNVNVKRIGSQDWTLGGD